MASIKPVGDKGLLVEFENKVAPEINDKVHSLYDEIKLEDIEGVLECIPTYRSLLINYDPLEVDFSQLKGSVSQLVRKVEEKDLDSLEHRVVILPTVYGGEFGPDLDDVCDINNLTQEEVVDIHSCRKYRVYMMGFTPGFPYLGGMSERISTPRLESPRKTIPAGSVGIGGNQTGVYPIDSPGGWRLIGRTPVDLYNPDENPPVAFKPGDMVEFVPVDEDDFERISEKVKADEYELEVRRS